MINIKVALHNMYGIYFFNSSTNSIFNNILDNHFIAINFTIRLNDNPINENKIFININYIILNISINNRYFNNVFDYYSIIVNNILFFLLTIRIIFLFLR